MNVSAVSELRIVSALLVAKHPASKRCALFCEEERLVTASTCVKPKADKYHTLGHVKKTKTPQRDVLASCKSTISPSFATTSTVGSLSQHYCANHAQQSNRVPVMSVRTLLFLIIALPALLLGGAKALGMTIPMPEWGRDYVMRFAFASDAPPLELPKISGPQDASRPLVVLDAGHGGRDPGKVQRRSGGGDVYEKDLVLALTLELRDRLLEGGGLRVALTREDDRIIPLAYRPEIARLLGADLFVSIHIDSAGDRAEVSGATVYTLSNEASSEAAARFAERENAADQLNGIEVETDNSQVSDILVELSQQRTQEDAVELAGLILREGEGKIKFHPFAKRSAELAVLRAPDVPGVLFESGFVTNDQDLAKLMSKDGRTAYVDVLDRAIRVYLARRAEP